MKKTLVSLIGAMALISSAPAAAQTAPWKASEVSGDVVAKSGNKVAQLKTGTALATGTVIETGANGRVVLVRGKEFITLAQNTRIRLAEPKQTGGLIQIVQDIGNAIFRIEKKSTPHFGVKTPYLAAVVKGTTFSITVTPAAASMQVTEGIVEVSTNDGGARSMVRAGSVAMVDRNDLFRMTVSGDQNEIVDSPARPADAGRKEAAVSTETAVIIESIVEDPIELASLSNGLVTGNGGVDDSVAVKADTQQPASVPAASNSGAGNNGSNAGAGDDFEKDKADKADKGDKGGGDKADKPDKGDKDKGGDKGGDDKADKPDEGDKGDDDKADKPDEGDKGDDDKADKPDEGDKGDDDKADKPDEGDKDKGDDKGDKPDKADKDKGGDNGNDDGDIGVGIDIGDGGLDLGDGLGGGDAGGNGNGGNDGGKKGGDKAVLDPSLSDIR